MTTKIEITDEMKRAVIFGMVKPEKYQAVCDVIIDGKTMYQAEFDHKQPENSLNYTVRKANARLAEYKAELEAQANAESKAKAESE